MKATREIQSTFDHLANIQKYADFNKASELYANLFKFKNNQIPAIRQLYAQYNVAKGLKKKNIETQIIDLEKIERQKFYNDLLSKVNDSILALEKITNLELLYSVLHVFADKLQNMINLSENKLLETSEKENCKTLSSRLEALNNKAVGVVNENLVKLIKDFELEIDDFKQKHQEACHSIPDNYAAKIVTKDAAGAVGRIIGAIVGVIVTFGLFYDSPPFLIGFLIIDLVYIIRVIIYLTSGAASQNRNEKELQFKSTENNKKLLEKKLLYLEYYHPIRDIYKQIQEQVPHFTEPLSKIYKILANKDADFLVDYNAPEPEEIGNFDIVKALQDPEAIIKTLKKGNKLRAVNLYKLKYKVSKLEAKKAIELIIANGMVTDNLESIENRENIQIN